MNIILEPCERTILNFKYEDRINSETQLRMDINWLGFDKFENLVYGLRSDNLNQVELNMMSIFGSYMKVVKKIAFPKYPKGFIRYTAQAISTCGDYIALVHYSVNYSDILCFHFDFDMLSVESGSMESYKVSTLFHPSDMLVVDFKVYHISSKIWICAILTPAGNTISLFRFVFNDLDKTCLLQPLYDLRYSPGTAFWPTICNNDAMFFSDKGDLVDIFSCESNSCSRKTLHGLPKLESFHISGASQSRITAVRTRLLNKKNEGYPMYKLHDDKWEKMSILLYCLIPLNEPLDRHFLLQHSFHSKTTLFLSFNVYKSLQVYVLCATINVLPLKSLCMRQIFSNCRKLNEQNIIQYINLPYRLKRQYFGPKWTWDGLTLFGCS